MHLKVGRAGYYANACVRRKSDSGNFTMQSRGSTQEKDDCIPKVTGKRRYDGLYIPLAPPGVTAPLRGPASPLRRTTYTRIGGFC